MPPDHLQMGGTQSTGGLHIGAAADLQHRAADQPGEGRDARDGDAEEEVPLPHAEQVI